MKLMHALVCNISTLGGAIMFGVDKNKFGFTVGAYVGGTKVLNKWYRPEDEARQQMHEELDEFNEDLRALILGA